MQAIRRQIVRVAILLTIIILFPFGFSRIASPWRCVSVHTGATIVSPKVDRATLRIACYNIAHGRGQSATNWTGESRAERMKRLGEIAELIKTADADLVILNEVDFDSSWSHSVNQADYLAGEAGYPHWAEQRNLDFRVVLWKWRFGNAVLSRIPIDEARALEFPGYSTLETWLAGKKRGLECSLQYNDKPLTVAGIHLSHRSETVRSKSVPLLQASVVAGDFNSTPTGFPYSSMDAQGGNALDALDATGRYVRRAREAPNGDSQLTYHAADPKSVIDWIVVSNDWDIIEYKVVPSLLSDHRMVVAEIAPTSSR